MSGYNSFYGGRRGASFIIVKKYATIKEMVAEFSKGGDYKTVNYDEYVLIDTESKNDADNGKIFRRGYEYNNDMGGAIYMGQIVGPSGPAPHVEMKSIKEVKEIQERDNFTYRRGEGKYNPTENLIPGKYIDSLGFEKYNDEISWAFCSVRDELERDTTAHIGFKFPYTVIEYTASSVSPYYNRDSSNKDFNNLNLVDRIDNGEHPFYEKWDLKIPKGIKGDSFKNLKVIYANSNIEPYEGQEDDINNNRQVIIYTYYDYEKSESGNPVNIYLGDFNMVKNINLENDGTFIIRYTHDDEITYNKKIRWVNKTELNVNNGKLKIAYNTGEEYNTQLIYPIAVEVDSNTGIFKMTYTNGATYEKRLIYPKDIKINTGTSEGEGNQKVNVTFTDGTNKDIGNPINYIMNTACNKDTSWHLYVLYSDSNKRGQISYNGRNDWTDLGYIGNGEVGCIVAKESDTTAQALINELPPYSAWMIIEE